MVENPKNNEVTLTFLGQAGFLIKGGSIQFLIDPYLSNSVAESDPRSGSLFHRQFAPPILPEQLYGIDYVFITHAHGDHCDPQTLRPIMQNNPECKLIGSPEVVKSLIEAGFPPASLLTCKPDKTNELPGIMYMGIPAAHYQLEMDEEGYARYLSYLVQCGDFTIFHAGDSILYNGYIDKIKAWPLPIDIACIPVNGRDHERDALGIIGNLHPQEALELAKDLGVKMMIPMHNDLFAGNRTPSEELNSLHQANYSQLNVKWMSPGETLTIQ